MPPEFLRLEALAVEGAKTEDTFDARPGLSTEIQISIVICTRNRLEILKTCLQYVAEQEAFCSWELVVVDNGSSDGTGTFLGE